MEDFVKLREEVLKLKKPGDIEKLLKYKTAYERFRETALSRYNRYALHYFGNNITYGELLGLIDRMANGFAAQGIGYDDVVTISTLGTPSGIAAFYALDKIGALMHMVNSASSAKEVARELKHCPSKYVVANDVFCSDEVMDTLDHMHVEKIMTTSLLDYFPMGFNFDRIKFNIAEAAKGLKQKKYDNKRILTLDQVITHGKEKHIEVEAASFKSEHEANIAYTSGSMGDSKGCVGDWDAMDAMVQVMAMTEQGRFQAGDIMFTTFPTWINYALLNMIHEPLCLGVSIALDPLFNPKDLAKRNNLYHFNHWLTIPPYIKVMAEVNKKTDCSRWKIVLTGGAELDNETKYAGDAYIARNNGTAKIQQGYGANELLGAFAYGYYPNATVGSVGKPCIGNKIKIVDPETLKELPTNEVGLALVYSPSLMKRYYNNEEATKKSFIKDEDGTVWYNTEDLMRVNEKGEVFLVDRIRRMVLTLDENGNPTKIIPSRPKKAIEQLNMVDHCEIITVKDDKTVNKSIAFIKTTKGTAQDETLKQNIIEFCEQQVPKYMAPREVIYLDEFPLNATKKVDLKALEKMYEEQHTGKETTKSKNKTFLKRK